MTQKVSPFLEGKYGWDFGESGWNSGMDENLLKFSFLFDGNIDSEVDTLPAPTSGQSVFLNTDKRLYFSVSGTWYSSPTPLWHVLKIKSTGQSFIFNGSGLINLPDVQSVADDVSQLESDFATLGSAAFQDEAFFATSSQLDVVSAQANSYTDTVFSNLADTTSEEQGAKKVGFLSPFTGATPLSVFDKISYTVSVMDFGAVGDGVADDTAAVQAALDSGAKVVKFPAGKTFRWAGNGPTVRSNTTLIGYGCIIVQPNSDTSATISVGNEFVGFGVDLGSVNIHIEGFDIRGPQYATTPTPAYRSIGISIRGRYDQYFYNNPNYPSNPPEAVSGTSVNITIKNNKINGFGQSAIQADQIDQFVASGNYINYCCRDGVRIYGTRHFTVVDNFVRYLGPGMPLEGTAPNNNVYGVECTRIYHSPDANGSTVAYRPPRFGVVSRNIIRDIPGWKGLGTHGGTDITFADNIVIDAHIGIGVDKGGFNSQDGFAPPRRIKIHGNSFFCTDGVAYGNRSAIFCVAHDATESNFGEDLTISNNTIYGPWGEDTRDGGIVVSNYRRVGVSDNIITNAFRSAINLQQVVEEFNIKGGVITNTGMTSSSFCTGISCQSGNQRGLISGVVFRKTDTSDVMTAVSIVAPNTNYGVTLASDITTYGTVTKVNTPASLAVTSPYILQSLAWANINNSGTASISVGRGVLSATRSSAGVVRVVLSSPASSSASMVVSATAKGSAQRSCMVNVISASEFDIYIRDTAGTLVDTGFYVDVKAY